MASNSNITPPPPPLPSRPPIRAPPKVPDSSSSSSSLPSSSSSPSRVPIVNGNHNSSHGNSNISNKEPRSGSHHNDKHTHHIATATNNDDTTEDDDDDNKHIDRRLHCHVDGTEDVHHRHHQTPPRLSTDSTASLSTNSNSSLSSLSRSSAASTLPKPSQRDKQLEERKMLLNELVLTEKSFYFGLKCLTRHILRPLLASVELSRPMISPTDIGDCFGKYLPNLCSAARDFYHQLRGLQWTHRLNENTTALPDVIQSMIPTFQCYVAYVNCVEEYRHNLKTLRSLKPEFDLFVTVNEKWMKTSVESILLTPVQRIPRYLVLSRSIAATFTLSTSSTQNTLTNNIIDPHVLSTWQRVIADLSYLSAEIHQTFHQREARQRVLDVQRHLEGSPVSLVTPTRFHVRDGPLLKKYADVGRMGALMGRAQYKRYWFFLFDDLLMYTTIPNSRGDCKLKYILPLLDMSVRDTSTNNKKEDPDTKSKFTFEIKSGVKDLSLAADTLEDKIAWLTQLQTHISALLKNKMTTVNINPTLSSTPPTSSSPMSASSSSASAISLASAPSTTVRGSTSSSASLTEQYTELVHVVDETILEEAAAHLPMHRRTNTEDEDSFCFNPLTAT